MGTAKATLRAVINSSPQCSDYPFKLDQTRLRGSGPEGEHSSSTVIDCDGNSSPPCAVFPSGTPGSAHLYMVLHLGRWDHWYQSYEESIVFRIPARGFASLLSASMRPLGQDTGKSLELKLTLVRVIPGLVTR
jgi:hypothetical protein